MSMEEIEREAIAQTLERTRGNVRKTAEILNYHRPRLYRKMKSFGLRGGTEKRTRPSSGKTLAMPKKLRCLTSRKCQELVTHIHGGHIDCQQTQA